MPVLKRERDHVTGRARICRLWKNCHWLIQWLSYRGHCVVLQRIPSCSRSLRVIAEACIRSKKKKKREREKMLKVMTCNGVAPPCFFIHTLLCSFQHTREDEKTVNAGKTTLKLDAVNSANTEWIWNIFVAGISWGNDHARWCHLRMTWKSAAGPLYYTTWRLAHLQSMLCHKFHKTVSFLTYQHAYLPTCWLQKLRDLYIETGLERMNAKKNKIDCTDFLLPRVTLMSSTALNGYQWSF